MIITFDEDSSGFGSLFRSMELKKFHREWMDGVAFHLLDDMEEVTSFFDEAFASSVEYIAMDLETDSLNVREATIVGCSFAFNDKKCAYVPLNHSKGTNVSFRQFTRYFESIKTRAKWLFYNARFDAEVLYFNGIDLDSWSNFEDVMLCVALNNSNEAEWNAGLKSASSSHLGRSMVSFSDAIGGKGNSEVFTNVSTEIATIYAGSDALNTLALFNKFKHVKTEQSFIYKLETQLIDVMREIERYGVGIDIPYFETISKRMENQIQKEKNEILSLVNKTELEINLDSNEQVGQVLFGEMGIPNPHKTEKGKFKVDAETMETLAKETDNKVLRKYVYYRQLCKLQSTYIQPFIEHKERSVGYIGLKQFLTATGRFKGSGDRRSHLLPINVQSIPAVLTKEYRTAHKILNKTMGTNHYHHYDLVEWWDGLYCKTPSCDGCPFEKECEREDLVDFVLPSRPNIRRGFIARSPEFTMFTIDYSGVELRMVTNLSKEPRWLQEFLEGEGDLHRVTASDVFCVPIDKVTKSQRSVGKTINFLSLYGGSEYALASQINASKKQGEELVTVEEAREQLKRFWDGLPVIVEWKKKVVRNIEKTGYVATDFGRRRPLPILQKKLSDVTDYLEKKELKRDQSKAIRDAISLKVQGTSADLMKIAMLRCSNKIKQMGWSGKVFIITTIHDELVFECRKDLAAEVIPILVKEMKVEREKWPVKFETDIEFSDYPVPNWGFTVECRLLENGKIYPTSLAKKALAEGLSMIEYIEKYGIEPLVK